MVHVIKTIDAHVGGAPLRLVIDGMPAPIGKTMAQKRDWLKRHGDHYRRALVLEPRGHRDMCGAMLVDPVVPGSDAGILFMQDDGYTAISGHGTIAVAAIAIEHGFFGGPNLTFDTIAGTVRAHARVQPRGERTVADSIAFINVPSFVWSGGHAVRVGTRELRVDIAYGGGFYAIVDTESIGVPLVAAKVPELRRLGVEIRTALNASGAIMHPIDAHLTAVTGVIFTGPPQDPEAHLRNVTVFGNGAVDRSPCATGTSAVMAVLAAMGLLDDDQPFVHESLIGTLHRGRIVHRTAVGEFPAISTEVEGTAWITGEHTFRIDDDDLLKDGFEL